MNILVKYNEQLERRCSKLEKENEQLKRAINEFEWLIQTIKNLKIIGEIINEKKSICNFR